MDGMGTLVLDADEEAAGQALEHEAILLAVQADRWHVHDGQQLLDVVRQHIVEQALVALLRVHRDMSPLTLQTSQ